jgi:hypothetical protein
MVNGSLVIGQKILRKYAYVCGCVCFFLFLLEDLLSICKL